MKEISFQDLKNITGGSKRGYSKTPKADEYVEAAVSCDSIDSPYFFTGCEITCNNNSPGQTIAFGVSSCEVGASIQCGCDYIPSMDKGCICEFTTHTP